MDELLNQYIKANIPIYKEQLKSLIEIPSISQDEKHHNDLHKVLQKTESILKEIGFTSEIIETKGNPVLLAKLELNKNNPWITIYNHMDVQPANEPQWETNPFEAIEKDNKIYGRGSTDDKGPALTIIHAINYLKQNNLPLPNIQIIYETEEEIGSKNFKEFLDKANLETPESILISDTIFEGTTPAITYKLRGLVRAIVKLKTHENDLHSGVYGGIAMNPFNILSQALGNCLDKDGKIKIPGFYDDVIKPSINEIQELAKDDEEMQYEGDLYTKDKMKIINAIHNPTFEIHGYYGGQCNENQSIKTAIPYEAYAKISMRIVPNQDPNNIIKKLETFLKTIHPNIEVTFSEGNKGTITKINNKFMKKAQEACEFGFGKKALFVATGGTIGAVPKLQEKFNVPIVLIAQSLISDGYHAPNEHFRIEQAEKGIKTMVKYLKK